MAFPTTTISAAFEAADLQSSAGVATGWNDTSGNARHLTIGASAPAVITVGGVQRAVFTAGNEFILPSGIASNAQSMAVYLVVRRPWSLTTNAALVAMPTDGNGVSLVVSSSNKSYTAWDGASKATTVPLKTRDNTVLVAIESNSTNATIRVGGESSSTAAVLGAATGTGGTVGNLTTGNASFKYAGDIVAMYFYTAPLSSPDLATLRTHVQTLYGVGSATLGDAWIACGDSITFGTGTTLDAASQPTYFRYLRQFARLYASEIPTWGLGVPSRPLSTCDANYVTEQQGLVQFAVARGYSRVLCPIFAGTNDIALNSATSSAVQTSFISLAGKIRADGGKVVAVTILPRTDNTSGENAILATYNTWLRANWATYADYLVDLAADSRLSTASNTTYYSVDGIHPNDTGAGVIASLFYAGLTADTTAPTVTAASINAAGTTLSLTFSEAVTGVSATNYTLSGGATLSAASGSGTAWTMTITPAVLSGQTRTLSYSGSATIDAASNALVAFSGAAVTNSSTTLAVAAAPSIASQTSTTATLNTNASNGLGTKVYAWSTTSGSGTSFSNSAVANPVVTYTAAGSYTHSVTVTDDSGSATATVNVTIAQVQASIAISPTHVGATPVDVVTGTTPTFTASATDQFSASMTPATPAFSKVSGVGSINSSSGVYTAGAVEGAAVVRVTSAGFTADANLLVRFPNATTTILTGATSGVAGSPVTYTLELPPSYSLVSPVVFTPAMSTVPGTFTPSAVTLSSAFRSQSFTFNASAAGTGNLTVSDNGGLTDPTPITGITFTAAPTGDGFTSADRTEVATLRADVAALKNLIANGKIRADLYAVFGLDLQTAYVPVSALVIQSAIGLEAANLPVLLENAAGTTNEIVADAQTALAAAIDSKASQASVSALPSADDIKSQADAALADVGLTPTVTGRIDAPVSEAGGEGTTREITVTITPRRDIDVTTS